MKFLLSLVICAAVAWGNSTGYYGWTPEKEYIFSFESQVLNGMPEINSQYAGLKLKSDVRVQAFSDYTLRIQFQDPTFVTVNEERLELDGQGRMIDPRERLEPVPEEISKYLRQPFVANLKRGVVEEVIVEKSEPVVVTNIKKSFLAQIQLDLSASGRDILHEQSQSPSQQGQSPPPKEATWFSTVETTLLGTCETEYTVHKLPEYQKKELESNWANDKYVKLQLEGKLKRSGVPNQRQEQSGGEEACRDKPYYQITKTKNLSNCRQRPVFQQVYGISSHCDASKNSCKNLLSHISSTKYIVCGSPQESFIIRKIVTENTIITEPMGWNTKEDIKSTTLINTSLKSFRSISQPLQKPQQPKQKKSLTYEYPEGHPLSPSSPSDRLTKEDQDRAEQRYGIRPIFPMPDLKSSPDTLIPLSLNKHQIYEQVIQNLKEVSKEADKSPESCATRRDVAGHLQQIVRVLRVLSLEHLEELYSKVQMASGCSEQQRKVMKSLFQDACSMTGSNPTVMFILNQVKSGQVSSYEEKVELFQNSIRNVKTPTKKLLSEILDAIKSFSWNEQQQLKSSSLTQLSDLVYRACVNPSTAVSEFPSYMYGRFCDEHSEFIHQQLVPYLEQQLESTSKQQSTEQSHQRLVICQSLGKIGVRSTLKPLSKIIDGSQNSEEKTIVRSIAVYSLKRLAQRQGPYVRPLLLTLIDNPAENPEVRMAAIAVLPYSQPQTAELQKIAIRTWFEPSKQVSSFLASTFNSLKNTKVPELKQVGQQVKALERLVKPMQEGIQFSQNMHFSTFVDYLKIVSNQKILTVNSEHQAVPSKLQMVTQIFGDLFQLKPLEFSVYSHGMDYLLEKLIDPSGKNKEMNHQVRDQLEKLNSQLNIQKRSKYADPEAHIKISSFGMDRSFWINQKQLQEAKEFVARELRRIAEESSQEPMQYNFTKFKTVAQVQGAGPSDAGFLIHMEKSVPLVMAYKGKFEIKSANPEESLRQSQSEQYQKLMEYVVKPVTNVKYESHLGVISPLTKECLAVGVDMSIHSATPFRAELEYNRHGQITLKLTTPEESNAQTETMHLNVKPYTAKKSLDNIKPISKSSSVKDIIAQPEGLFEQTYDWGQYIKVDGKCEVKTNYKHTDLYSFLEKIYRHNPSSLLEAGGLLPTVRRTSLRFLWNPSTSQNKEILLRMSFAKASKESNSDLVSVSYPRDERLSLEKEIEKMCWESSDSQHQKDQCEQQERRRLLETENESAVEISKKAVRECSQHSESQRKSCLVSVRVCEEAKRQCQRAMERRGKSTEEEQEICDQKELSCLARQQNAHKVKDILKQLQKGEGMSVTFDATVGRKGQKRGLARFSVSAGGKLQAERYTSKIDLTFMQGEQSQSSTDYKIELFTEVKAPQIQNKWNKEKLLQEDLNVEIDSQLEYGFIQSGDKQKIKSYVQWSKTESQRNTVRQSPAWQLCSQMEQKQQQLAPVCQQVRHQAAAVDRMIWKIKVPSNIANSQYLQKFKESVMSILSSYAMFFSPNSIEKSMVTPNPSEPDCGELKIQADFKHDGSEAQLQWTEEQTGQQYRVKDIRLPLYMNNVLPMSMRNGIVMRLVQKVTRNQAPESCRIEPNIIGTFDNLTYEYPMNDCEHLLYKDCSETLPFAVTSKSQQGQTELKVMAGKAFVQLKSRSRGSSGLGQNIQVEVNGQPINIQPGQTKNLYENEQEEEGKKILQIQSYLDGVTVVRHPREVFEVAFDGQSVEVVVPERLRSKSCGLCGDSNGENTADVLGPRKCVYSKKRFSGYSYMIEESCSGVPQQDKQHFQNEQRQCTPRESFKTPLQRLIHSVEQGQLSKPKSRVHLFEVERNSVCLSKQLVKICPAGSRPMEVQKREVQYACVQRPSAKAQQMIEKAKFGQQILELESLPTAYTQLEIEPVQCSKPNPRYQSQYEHQQTNESSQNYRTSTRRY